MGKKPKARPAAKETRKPKETQKEQSARFVEAARTIGVDETGKQFEGAINKIIRQTERD